MSALPSAIRPQPVDIHLLPGLMRDLMQCVVHSWSHFSALTWINEHEPSARSCCQSCCRTWTTLSKSIFEKALFFATDAMSSAYLGHFSRHGAGSLLAPVDVGPVIPLLGEFGHQRMMGR